jgi:hypothetical protein
VTRCTHVLYCRTDVSDVFHVKKQYNNRYISIIFFTDESEYS